MRRSRSRRIEAEQTAAEEDAITNIEQDNPLNSPDVGPPNVGPPNVGPPNVGPSEDSPTEVSLSNMEKETTKLIDEIKSLKKVVDKNNTDAATLFGLIDNLIAAYNDKENLEATASTKTQELEQLQSQLKTVLSGIGVTSDASSEVREAVDAVADGTIIKKITNLKDDLSAQKIINDTTMSRLATAQEKLQQVNADLQSKEASILGLQIAAADKQAAINKLETDIQNLKKTNTADIARLEKEKENAIATTNTKKQEEIQKEQREKTQLQEKLDELQIEFQTKSTILVQLQTKLDKERGELEARIQAAETKATQDLEIAEREKNTAKKNAAEAAVQAAETAGKLQEQIDDRTREIDALKSEKGNCDTQIAKLTEQLRIARERVSAQVPKLSEMSSSVGEMRSRVGETNTAREGLVTRIPPKINKMSTLNTDTADVAAGGRKKTRKKKKKRKTTKRVVFKSKKQNKKTRIKKINKMNRKPVKKFTRRRK